MAEYNTTAPGEEPRNKQLGGVPITDEMLAAARLELSQDERPEFVRNAIAAALDVASFTDEARRLAEDGVEEYSEDFPEMAGRCLRIAKLLAGEGE